MADPIRFKMQRDVRAELFRKLQTAPEEHAAAMLSAYELLQEAHDHGVLDTLRGAIGAGETFIGKAAEYANTAEGIRTMRNLLAMVRLLGEIDPALLDSAVQAVGSAGRRAQKHDVPPSLWQSLRRLAGIDGRRGLAAVADVAESFANGPKSSDRPSRSLAGGAVVPVAGAIVVVFAAALWMKHRA